MDDNALGDAAPGDQPSRVARASGARVNPGVLSLRPRHSARAGNGSRADVHVFMKNLRAAVAAPAPLELFYWRPVDPVGIDVERAVIDARLSREEPHDAFLHAVLGVMNRGRMESSFLERPLGTFEFGGLVYPRLKAFSCARDIGLLSHTAMALDPERRAVACIFFAVTSVEARGAGASGAVVAGLVELATLFMLCLDADVAKDLVLERNVFAYGESQRQACWKDVFSKSESRRALVAIGENVKEIIARFKTSAAAQSAGGFAPILHPADHAARMWLHEFMKYKTTRRALMRGRRVVVPAPVVMHVERLLRPLLRRGEYLAGTPDGLFVNVSIASVHAPRGTDPEEVSFLQDP